MKLLPLTLACALILPAAAGAAPIVRVYGAPESPIASLTLVPAGDDIAFVSGTTPGAQGQPKPVDQIDTEEADGTAASTDKTGD